MGGLVTKPFHSDDVTKQGPILPYAPPLKKVTWLGHVFGSRKGCHALDVTQGLEIVGNRPHHFSNNNNMVYSKLLKKEGLQAGTCVDEEKGRRPFFHESLMCKELLMNNELSTNLSLRLSTNLLRNTFSRTTLCQLPENSRFNLKS